MKFCEAMKLLKSGVKVTRQPWKDGVYFLMEGNDVKSFQPKISPYIYNEDIMISEGWLVEGQSEEFQFCEIVPYLKQGFRAKLKDWNETFIFLDNSCNHLVVHSMDVFPFIPDFESFTAQDWAEI